MQNRKESHAPNPTIASKPKKKEKIIPDDPVKYGASVRSKADSPHTKLQWEVYMKNYIDDIGLLENERAREALEYVKQTPEELEEKMKKLDRSISEIEKAIREDPSNNRMREKLQKLYRLRAISVVLQKEVILMSSEDKMMDEDIEKILNQNPPPQEVQEAFEEAYGIKEEEPKEK